MVNSSTVPSRLRQHEVVFMLPISDFYFIYFFFQTDFVFPISWRNPGSATEWPMHLFVPKNLSTASSWKTMKFDTHFDMAPTIFQKGYFPGAPGNCHRMARTKFVYDEEFTGITLQKHKVKKSFLKNIFFWVAKIGKKCFQKRVLPKTERDCKYRFRTCL